MFNPHPIYKLHSLDVIIKQPLDDNIKFFVLIEIVNQGVGIFATIGNLITQSNLSICHCSGD